MMNVSSWAVDQNERSIWPKHRLYKAKMAQRGVFVKATWKLVRATSNSTKWRNVSYAPGIAAIAWPCLTASSSVPLRHDGNPSIWPACAAFAFLFLVPKILEKFVFSSTNLSTLTFSEPSVNAVDVVRAIAIWYSTFASFQSSSTQKFTARITGRDTKSKICVADFLFESGPRKTMHWTPRTQVYFHLAWQTAFICLERFCFETTNTTCLRNAVFRNRNMYRNIYI